MEAFSILWVEEGFRALSTLCLSSRHGFPKSVKAMHDSLNVGHLFAPKTDREDPKISDHNCWR